MIQKITSLEKAIQSLQTKLDKSTSSAIDKDSQAAQLQIAGDRLSSLLDPAIQVMAIQRETELLDRLLDLDKETPLPQKAFIEIQKWVQNSSKAMDRHEAELKQIADIERSIQSKALELSIAEEISGTPAEAATKVISLAVMDSKSVATPKINEDGEIQIDRREIQMALTRLRADQGTAFLFEGSTSTAANQQKRPATMLEEGTAIREQAAQEARDNAKQILTSGKNPFSKGPTFNLTNQGQLMRHFPSEARQLQAAAANF
jgi:hypothetical protein